MKRKTLLLSVILLACVFPMMAQQVTKEQAMEKASAFFSRVKTEADKRKTPRKAPQLQLAIDSEELYLFNDVANKGYVIISGDERTPEVLAYSYDGHFDTRNVPCNMQAVLDGYKEQISYLRTHPDYKMPVPRRAEETKVAPLLGETAWDQFWPYNEMCPVIDGQHLPTGCVATAAAQVMYYHKWPEKGLGNHSYEWNGQTLSADFSQSVYRWDLMTPTYNKNSSKESCDAVALLMRDVGYACEMYYSLGGSSPHLWIEKGLATYFDYDESLVMLNRGYCDEDSWHNYILEDLINGRPVLYSGQPKNGGVGHELVIDGYDGDGYFHFNFGWSGSSSGYYTMLNIPTFNSDQEISFGIKKNSGEKRRSIFASNVDFLYVQETNTLECKSLQSFYVWGNEYQTALAVENSVTHEVKYTNKENRGGGQWYVIFHFNETLADGDYTLYPVARLNEEDPWQKALFYDNRQTFVDLNVTNGVKTYANNHISDYIQDGVVIIDDIFYILDDTKYEATVTSKNDKYNSYSGDVTIPETVTYKNQDYQVTTIDKKAFYESKGLVSVNIPNSILSIGDEAFSYSGIKSVIIPDSTKKIGANVFSCCASLTEATIPDSWEIIPWGLFNHTGLEEIIIPSSITRIGGSSFSNTKLTSVKIPNSVTSIDNYVFWDCFYLNSVEIPNSVTTIGSAVFYRCGLKDVYVTRENPMAYNCSEDAFLYISFSTCVLHVPVGSKEAYATTAPWSQFLQIVEEENLGIDNVSAAPNDDNTNSIYSIRGMEIRQKDIRKLPKGIYIQGNKKIVRQ